MKIDEQSKTEKINIKEIGITVKKNENFSKWYTQVVLKAGLADYAPVGGCMIIKPLGYGIWEIIQKTMDEKFKKTGVKNVYFPLFIPESLLKKEAEHFEGFSPEVAWITHGGDSKLSERLAIRPTSETIMYDTFSKWIRSHRDLPLLVNQWCSVTRWETKATKLFLRTKEFLWQEGHTVHATKKEADERVMMMLNIYKDVVEQYLAIPVLDGKKSEMEKFAGAYYTTTIEALMPDGKSLQAGTSHNLGQHFAEVFNIRFLDKDTKEKHPWQTSWGVSTRLIGALVMVHGDDRGLVLPPRVAPIQVVIVPISGEKEKKVLKKSKDIKSRLEKSGISVELDDRDEYTPGWKFNEWEMRGVPVRVEIGPRDLEENQLILVRRDNNEKLVVKEIRVVEEVSKTLEAIHNNLFKRAKKFLDEHITSVQSREEFKRVLKEKGGFLKTSWCSRLECEEKINEETGATVRIIPFEKEKTKERCFYCGKKAETVGYFARAY